MTTVRELVSSPMLAPLLSYVVRPRGDRIARRLTLAEDLDDLHRAPERSIVLLTHTAAAQASRYRFDVALRLARIQGVAALVLPAPAVSELTPTAPAIADRAGLAILGAGADVDLADLAVAIGRELAAGADAALVRAHAALRAIAVHPREADPEALLQHAGRALGTDITMRDARDTRRSSVPVSVDGQLEGWLIADRQEGDLGLAVDIVLQASAIAVARALAEHRRAEDLPIESREEVLTAFIAAPSQSNAPLISRARTLGLPIEGWHNVVRLEPEGDGDATNAFAAYHARLHLARVALRQVRGSAPAQRGEWHSARDRGALVLIYMQPSDPGAAASTTLTQVMNEVLTAVRALTGCVRITCGVGSAHPGPEGLLASAAEARSAIIAAHVSGRLNQAQAFDATGLRRALVDWYASDAARAAVTTVLAPLRRLEPARADRLIHTLHVFLDQGSSLTRTAKVMGLHRNAVAYRVNQAFELLDVDRSDPDDLLLLQLACRARSLS